MAKQFAISTVDNPYNPITQFDLWYQFDEQMGYHTCALLGRFVKTSIELPESEQDDAISDAIDDIIRMENYCALYEVAGYPLHVKVESA